MLQSETEAEEVDIKALTIRKQAFMDAAEQVAGYWNDSFAMVNQKQQAEWSAAALRLIAKEMT